MRWIKRGPLVALLCVCAAGALAKEMSVQIREGQLREKASFLGRPVADVSYGDRLTVMDEEGAWIKVSGEPGTGWIHESSLTKKKIVLKASASDVERAASGEELALAGKGFNSDVEAKFKANNAEIDFTWIDKMEQINISEKDRRDFLAKGGVEPSENGGAQ